MSTSSIGVNLRVTGHCNQGGRKYMEDVFTVAYQQTEDDKDLEYAYFGIFDGHGGREAALFAKEHLMDSITKLKHFWSEDDEQVLRSIRDGFLATQQAMWKDQVNWTKTSAGLPSTAGTTASICFIKRGKLFIGHCGDSGIVLGEKDPHYPERWRAKPLTTDHKPESKTELTRIQQSGGKVVNKSGVPRVVWYRPRYDHQGPVRRSTHIDEVPFLAVARALGDLWSYNAKDDVFIVSPDPDLHVYEIDALKDRCLVLATDGAWNVLSPEMAVNCAYEAEKNNERHMIYGNTSENTVWVNPSKKLVDLAIGRWNMCKLRADNTSIVTVMLDPPGPPRAQVLKKLHGIPNNKVQNKTTNSPPALPPKPSKGIAIISRFPNSKNDYEKLGTNLVGEEAKATKSSKEPTVTRIVHDSLKTGPHRLAVTNGMASPNGQSDPDAAGAGPSITRIKDLPDRNIITETISQALKNSPDKSPSPPPLPVRPANLKKFTTTASSSLPPSPLVPPVPLRSKPGNSSVPPSSPAPIRPVKQVRRSILPEYNSDSENQPQVPSSSRRRSCDTINQRNNQVQKTVSRRSDPPKQQPLPPKQLINSNTTLASSTTKCIKALRPRNDKDSSAVTKKVTPQQQQASAKSSPVTRSSTKEQQSKGTVQRRRSQMAVPTFSMAGGIKRKRRSLDQLPSKISKTCNNSQTWGARSLRSFKN